MIPFEQAVATVDRVLAGRRLPAERIPVAEAHGRVLAEDARSRLDLPPFTKSAMDGYAVLPNDEREQYRVLEHVPAGTTPAHRLEPGTATKVMTGAPVPEGTGRVIIVEHTDGGEDVVRVFEHDDRPNICRQGEDVRRGDTVLARGVTLNALAVANLIACGIAEAAVARRVRVAILTTGDEIVDALEAIVPGKIMDSNGPMLSGLAAENGLEVVSRLTVRDDRDALKEAVEQAADRADLVLLSGGVSAGDYDFVPAALTGARFTLLFDRVAMKPGKPLTFAAREDALALGLPGNPVSVFLTFHLFALRIAALLSGGRPPVRHVTATVHRDVTRKHVERTAFVPCTLAEDGTVEPVSYHGSGHLAALSAADGFLRIPRGVERIPAGGEVLFYPLML